MPASLESHRLAQTYRRQQLGIREHYLAEAAVLWPLFTRAVTREDIKRWLQVSTTLIHRYERLSWSLANVYYEHARNLDAPSATTSPPRARFEPMPNEQIVRNLLDRAPGTVKRAKLRGVDELEAEGRALAKTLASGGRMVLAGGRSAINRTVQADNTALGWMRITDGDPCYWCAMLAGRGAVYESEQTALFADGVRTYHDSDGCIAAPAFTRDEFVSARAKTWRAEWDEVTAGKSGEDAVKAWRRHYESRADGPEREGQPRSAEAHSRRENAPDSSRDVDAEGTFEQLRETLAKLEKSAEKFSSSGTEARIADLRNKIAARS